jgi:hypothetical protein
MPINTEIESEGYKRLRIPDNEMWDLNAKVERTLSFYEDLDEEFKDLARADRKVCGYPWGIREALFPQETEEIPYYNTFGDRMMLRGRYRVQFTS